MCCVRLLSHVRLFVTPWTVAHQVPLSKEFSRQEYWSGLPCPSPGDLSDPGIKPRSPALGADSLTSEPPGYMFYRVSNEENTLGGLWKETGLAEIRVLLFFQNH